MAVKNQLGSTTEDLVTIAARMPSRLARLLDARVDVERSVPGQRNRVKSDVLRDALMEYLRKPAPYGSALDWPPKGL